MDVQLPRPFKDNRVDLPIGTRTQQKSGYILVKTSESYGATDGNWRAEHRIVVEKIIGRTLLPDEQVHHKNGVRWDNRPENLELWLVNSHPRGQRISDLLAWAHEIIDRYEGLEIL